MAFTELQPGQTSLVLPSQAGLQQQLAGLSQSLQGMRQYMEGVKEQRQKEFVASTSFAIDPSITETAQRQKMIEDVESYVTDAKKLYSESDGEYGYLRLSPQQQVKLQNLRNDLVGKQGQRMAAQAAYAAQYKEFSDPKNIGLYDAEVFQERANAFKSGEIVTDFLQAYPVNTKKMIADMYGGIYKINKEDLQMKSVGMGSKAGLKTKWSSAFFGDTMPTQDQVNQAIGESAYEMFNTDPKFRYAVSQDIRNITQSNPEMLNQLQDPETFKKFLSEQYADVIKPVIYSQEYTSPTNIKTGGTTVNVGGGSGGNIKIYYNKAIDGYNFSGRGGAKSSEPIPYTGDIPSEFYVLDKKTLNTVPQSKQPPVEAFRNSKITGVIKKNDKVYAAVSVPKVETYEEDGKDKVRLSLDKTQVYYVPYGLVENVVKQAGYDLENWDKFYTGSPETQSAIGSPGMPGTMLND